MYELQFRAPDRWRSFWRDAKVQLAVAGTQEAPHPELEATLRGVTAAWPDVQRTIAEFVAALAGSEHVPLEPATLGGFAARTCGFEGALSFESISVTAPDAPGRVEVTFYTGYPDGYATYRVVLEDGRPVRVTAFAS
jgi:hypothetical protein